MATQIIVRIDSELKDKLAQVARREGKTASQVVRELVAGYVKERDLGEYIEDLWNRIGAGLRENGYTEADVEKTIKQVRAEKRRKRSA